VILELDDARCLPTNIRRCQARSMLLLQLFGDMTLVLPRATVAPRPSCSCRLDRPLFLIALDAFNGMWRFNNMSSPAQIDVSTPWSDPRAVPSFVGTMQEPQDSERSGPMRGSKQNSTIKTLS
jgi:hypothetical protein